MQEKINWTWSDRLAVALSCLAAIMALVLLWMDKTPVWAGVTIVAMLLLIVYPVLHFFRRWRARIPVLLFLWVAIGVFGWKIWPHSLPNNPIASAPDTPMQITEGYLEMQPHQIMSGNGNNFSLNSDKPIRVDTTFMNTGGRPVHEALITAYARIIELTPHVSSAEMDTKVFDNWQQVVADDLEKHPQLGIEIAPKKGVYRSDYTQPLEPVAIKGIVSGRFRVYMLAMSQWYGDALPKQYHWNCQWFSGSDLTFDNTSKSVPLHNCEVLEKPKLVVRHKQTSSTRGVTVGMYVDPATTNSTFIDTVNCGFAVGIKPGGDNNTYTGTRNYADCKDAPKPEVTKPPQQ